MVIEIEVPEDCVEIASIAIVQYLDPEGETRYSLQADGQELLTTYIGVLEWAKLKLAQDLLVEDEDE